MRIFLTGANGFIGSALVPELLGAGHQVLGLTRSAEGAKALTAAGAQALHGDLLDFAVLRKGVEQSEAVIHTAFNHDFSRFMESCKEDREAIAAMGEVLVGSSRPMVVTSSIGSSNTVPGTLPVEDNPTASSAVFPRAASDEAALALAERGVNVVMMRNPQIHNTEKQGLVTALIGLARRKGVAAYVGEGSNRWSATNISDAIRVYRLALEQAKPGAVFHAVDEEGVSTRDIANAIAAGLGIKAESITEEKAPDHFTWLMKFVGRELTASGKLTQERLGWKPTGAGLIADLNKMKY
jgi:nucleoside-diphosphate-sugar epimerase